VKVGTWGAGEGELKMKELTVAWRGPISLFDVARSERPSDPSLTSRGVYVWVCGAGTDARLRYVGRACKYSLWARARTHLLQQIGGSYRVPPGFVDQASPLRETGWEVDWSIMRRMNLLLEEDSFVNQVVRPAYRMAASISVWYAPLAIDDACLVERQLLYDLQPLDNGRKTMGYPREPVKILHEDAGWFTGGVEEQLRKTGEFRRSCDGKVLAVIKSTKVLGLDAE
jgi:hypothetical protein